MNKTTLAFASITSLCLWTSCSSDHDEPSPTSQSQCASAKCDGTGLPELSPISTGFGICEITPDLEDDLYFAVDNWSCQFAKLEEGLSVELVNVHTWATHDRSRSAAVTFDLSDSSTMSAGSWRGNDYPVTTMLRSVSTFTSSDFGRLGSPSVSQTSLIVDIESLLESRPSEAVVQEVALPFEFWPVVIWPSTEFSDNWTANEGGFFMFQINGDIDISGDTQSFSYGRYAIQGEDLRQLTSKTFYVPHQDGQVSTIEVRLDGNDLTASAEITGPGYYLLNADGSIAKVSTAEILEKGMSRIVGENPPIPEPDPLPNPVVEPEPEPLPEPTPEVDPCDSACSDTQVCVEESCVERHTQIQDLACNTSRAVCESTSDCADGHACVSGTCRRLTCQSQDQYCNAPNAVCAVNSDCADNHACVDALCRRLSCQTQDQFCTAPQAVCALNSDCEENHVCADGKCRRLICQVQDQFCNPSRGVCDGGETSDCAEGHVCEESRCKRLSCVR